MPSVTGTESKVGFQGSEHTGVEVRVYRKGADPVMVATGELATTGRNERDDSPAIEAVTTEKSLGSAGRWSVQLKPARRSSPVHRLLEQVSDDDWVDILFWQGRKPFHVMRGLVDDVRRIRSPLKTGYTISGTDFQKVWEKTPVWFDKATIENIGGSASLRVTQVPVDKLPEEVIDAYLVGFLKDEGGYGRANWELPSSLPGAGVGTTFSDLVKIDTSKLNIFGAALERRAVNPNFVQNGGNLWSMAMDWSDPLFCELFTDIIPGAEALGQMTVVYRMRPFPNLSLDPSGPNSLFWKLDQFRVPRQQIVQDSLGRSGFERFNDFRVGMQTQQEWTNTSVEITRPLWDPKDMRAHGQRIFDVNCKYVAKNNNDAGLSLDMRRLIRDWHCLNPYLLNGDLTLGVGRPDIRIGTVVRVPAASDIDAETFYVEKVSHRWSLPAGTKTTLGVTHGYSGTDDSFLDRLETVSGRYYVPPFPGALENAT